MNYKWQKTNNSLTTDIKNLYTLNVKELKAKDEFKLAGMKKYATDSECAKNIILEYFGQPRMPACTDEDSCNCAALKLDSVKVAINIGLKKIFS